MCVQWSINRSLCFPLKLFAWCDLLFILFINTFMIREYLGVSGPHYIWRQFLLWIWCSLKNVDYQIFKLKPLKPVFFLLEKTSSYPNSQYHESQKWNPVRFFSLCALKWFLKQLFLILMSVHSFITRGDVHNRHKTVLFFFGSVLPCDEERLVLMNGSGNIFPIWSEFSTTVHPHWRATFTSSSHINV